MSRMLIAVLAASAWMPAVAQHEGQHAAAPETGLQESNAHAEHVLTDEGGDARAPLGALPAVEADSREEAPPVNAHAGHETLGLDRRAEEAAPPPAALSGPRYAADSIFDAASMAAARRQLRREEGAFKTSMVLADRFETRLSNGDEEYLWDVQGWYGGDIHKLWLKSEGEGELGHNPEQAELQALYSRAITPFFDLQAGMRYDARPLPQRSHVVVGVQGLLPYVFEMDAAAFLSDDGDLSGRFEAEYDLRISQRLLLQPRVEVDFAAQATPELGIGAGVGSVEGGLRLRYEIRRELAPYVGIAWERRVGGTADFARAAGEDVRSREMVLGIRAWF